MRGLSLLNVIVNVVIVVTGGAVRLTGSGLGCPTWPNCAPDSFQPTAEMGIHGAIEWSNRILGVIVGVVAIAAFVAAVLRTPRRRSLVWLTGIVAVGVAAQGGIGAFTVNTGLAPWLVSVHFAVSMGLLTAAFAAWRRSGEPDGPPEPTVAGAVSGLWWLIIALAGAAIVAGTVVTGAGPHAGDPDAPRLDLDETLMSQLHADVVFLLLGASVALVFTMIAAGAPRAARRAAVTLLVVELAQGAIGMVQYFTGLPEILVGAHMLGAALLWLAVLAVGFSLRRRLVSPGPAGVTLTLDGSEDDEDDDTDPATAPTTGRVDETVAAES